MEFISPQPKKWYEIYQELQIFWKESGSISTPPPPALVLSGWTMSNDEDKMHSWSETLNWASENNCLHLVSVLKENEKYYVTELSSFRPYQYYTYDAKYKPTKEEIRTALHLLERKWIDILENNFGENTRPVKFSGRKSRCLMVTYNDSYSPPWGSWTNHLANGRPSKFSELRIKVNEIIKPVAVDHIIFKQAD